MKSREQISLVSVRRRRRKLLERIVLPPDALPGSLSVSRIRCGKESCHCREGEGHKNWTLTYMSKGSKQVKHIPADLVEYVRQKVEQGKIFKEEVNEIFGANVELLDLLRKQNKKR
jgi:uncharacterized protein DUF6788